MTSYPFLVIVIVTMLSPQRVMSLSSSECFNSSLMTLEPPTSVGTDVMSFSIESPSVVSNRLVLFHESSTATNVTLVVRRRYDVIGPICVFVRLISISINGDPSKPSSEIGIEGLPQSPVVIGSVDTVNSVAELGLTASLRGFHLGRSKLMVLAQVQQQAVNNDELTKSQTRNVEVPWVFNSSVNDSSPFYVLVNRPPMNQLSTASLLLLAFGMALNMLSFACRLHGDIIAHHVKRPFGILTGIGCQFIVMPTVAYLLGLIFQLPAHLRYALLVLGCSPGGGPSNLLTILFGGDLYMSVIMTCTSNFLSIGMIPLWICTLGATLMREVIPMYSTPVPWIALVVLGLLFSIPAVLGGLLRLVVSERTSIIVGMAIRVIGFMSTAAGLIGALYSNTWVFDYIDENWRVVTAVCLFSHFGYVISLLVAIIGRRSKQTAVTIAIEAGVQSLPSMLFVLQLTVPQPESMLGFTVAAIYLLNIVCAAFVSLLTIVILKRLWPDEKEPLVIEVGRDASPSIADSYSISQAADERKAPIDGGKLFSDINGFGSRNGSYSNLADKY